MCILLYALNNGDPLSRTMSVTLVPMLSSIILNSLEEHINKFNFNTDSE